MKSRGEYRIVPFSLHFPRQTSKSRKEMKRNAVFSPFFPLPRIIDIWSFLFQSKSPPLCHCLVLFYRRQHQRDITYLLPLQAIDFAISSIASPNPCSPAILAPVNKSSILLLILFPESVSEAAAQPPIVHVQPREKKRVRVTFRA